MFGSVVGRLVGDVESKDTKGGVLAKFTLAEDHPTKKDGDSEFWSCEAWGKTAESLVKYAKKGSQVFARGYTYRHTWGDAADKKYRTIFVVEGFNFVGGGKKTEKAEKIEQGQGDSEIPF
jgi:single-strand DNA-binding protein